jgi:hypothetical protein
MLKGGVYMTELLTEAFKTMLCGTSSMPNIYPKTDYQRHVPTSARQLTAQNWENAGNTLRKAMDKVREEDGPKF